MGLVMIRCPTTGRPIPTGLKVDRSSFSSTPVFFSRTRCPICRVNHEWFAKDAWVREEVDEPPSARTICNDHDQGHAPMERTVARLNIERLRRLLLVEADGHKRRMIARLLVEENARLANAGTPETEQTRRGNTLDVS
jgi:hypothetical protein